MTTELLLRYVHFISIFAIVGSLVSEHILLKPTLTRAELRRISIIDAVYGIAALILLGAGLTLWLSGAGKPSVYYSKNWIFHIKIALVASMGLLSIYPTLFFIKQSKGNSQQYIVVPKIIFWMLRFELLLILILPLLAGLMARGIGFYGNS